MTTNIVAVAGVVETRPGDYLVHVYTIDGVRLVHNGKADGTPFTRDEANRLAKRVFEVGIIDLNNWTPNK